VSTPIAISILPFARKPRTAMGKSWPFRKSKNDHKAGSSCGGRKKERDHRYTLVNKARRLWEEGHPMSCPDATFPSSWLLNSRQVPVPPVPHEDRARRDEIHHRRFILPPDPREDPTYALDSSN
jgi:hypothetical protein